LAVLAPDVIRRADRAALPPGVPTEIRGARRVAEGAGTFLERARLAPPALVNRTIGGVVAPRGRPQPAREGTIDGDRITAIDLIGDPGRLRQLDLAVTSPDLPGRAVPAR